MDNYNTENQKKKSPIGNVTRRKTHQEFVEEVFVLVGREYEVVGRYKNSKTKVKLKHNKCGHEWRVIPNSFTGSKGTRCPKCATSIRNKNITLSQEEFESRVREIHGRDYIVIGKYQHSGTEIEIKHSVCGTNYMVEPQNILRDKGCPVCRLSKGERDVKKFLDINLFDYEVQYRIDECRNVYPLPFDFAVFREGILYCLIEYDGRQHFEPIEHWGGEKEFQISKKRDAIKREYCEENNITLIEIPYWEKKNISEILEKQLSPYAEDKEEIYENQTKTEGSSHTLSPVYGGDAQRRYKAKTARWTGQV